MEGKQDEQDSVTSRENVQDLVDSQGGIVNMTLGDLRFSKKNNG